MSESYQTFFNIAVTLIGFLGGWVLNSLKASIDALHKADTDPDGTNGEWVACADNIGPRFTSADGGLTFDPPVVVPIVVPQRCTKRAFKKRFPKMPNNVSTKWDAMCMFLRDDSYAASLGVSGAALFDLRMLITTGTELMDASPFVLMGANEDAYNMTALLTSLSIPAEFRLTAQERNTILNTPLEEYERYVG